MPKQKEIAPIPLRGEIKSAILLGAERISLENKCTKNGWMHETNYFHKRKLQGCDDAVGRIDGAQYGLTTEYPFKKDFNTRINGTEYLVEVRRKKYHPEIKIKIKIKKKK